jgi:hypothetical protein
MDKQTPSDDALTLLHYASNAREGCADDSDRAYCADRAREWAAYIIARSA